MNELKKDVIRKAIKVDMFEQAIEVLKLRGEIFVSEGQNDDERILRKRTMEVVSLPCVECHLSDICRPDGVVNPKNCPYLLNW